MLLQSLSSLMADYQRPKSSEPRVWAGIFFGIIFGSIRIFFVTLAANLCLVPPDKGLRGSALVLVGPLARLRDGPARVAPLWLVGKSSGCVDFVRE